MLMEETCNQEWSVLINPISGDGKGRRDWEIISNLLKTRGITFKHYFTEYARHGVLLTRQLIEAGCTAFIVVGGDGFLNEVVNGIFSQDKTDPSTIRLGMIPVGTGNDWVRSFQIPFDYQSAVEIIRVGKTCLHDIGKVFYHQGEEEKFWYFINMCGMGFDAEVNKKVNANKGHGHQGPLKYQYHIFTTLLGYKPIMMKLKVDGTPAFIDTFSMTVAIARYNGGGMMQSPNAITDDGIFDVTVIKKISRLKVITSVKKLYDGSFIHMPEVVCMKGKDIHADALPLSWLEADGEALGHSPFRFEMLPSAIRVIIP